MVNQEVVRKARMSMKISGRYVSQNNPTLKRNDWTPKQKRRMRKKFRKHGISVPSWAEGGK